MAMTRADDSAQRQQQSTPSMYPKLRLNHVCTVLWRQDRPSATSFRKSLVVLLLLTQGAANATKMMECEPYLDIYRCANDALNCDVLRELDRQDRERHIAVDVARVVYIEDVCPR